jgi:hypothetical protein
MSIVKDNYVKHDVDLSLPQAEPVREPKMTADDALRACEERCSNGLTRTALGAGNGAAGGHLERGPAVRFAGKKGSWQDTGTHASSFEAEHRFDDGIKLTVTAFMKISKEKIVICWTVCASIGGTKLGAGITCVESSNCSASEIAEARSVFEADTSRSSNRCVARIRAAIAKEPLV